MVKENKENAHDTSTDVSDDTSYREEEEKMTLTKEVEKLIDLHYLSPFHIMVTQRIAAMLEIKNAVTKGNADERLLLQSKRQEHLQEIQGIEKRKKKRGGFYVDTMISISDIVPYILVAVFALSLVIMIPAITSGAIITAVLGGIGVASSTILALILIPLGIFYENEIRKDLYQRDLSKGMLADIDKALKEIDKDKTLTEDKELRASNEMQPDNPKDLNPQVKSESADSIPGQADDYETEIEDTPSSTITFDLTDDNKEEEKRAIPLKNTDSSQVRSRSI